MESVDKKNYFVVDFGTVLFFVIPKISFLHFIIRIYRMKKFLCGVLLLITGSGFAQTINSFSKYEDAYLAFKNLELDNNLVADVKNYTLKKDVGFFHFKEGKLTVAKAINDKIVAVVFDGKGEFEFTPSTKVEKDQLHRFYQKTTLKESFNRLFMFFDDSTYFILSRDIKFEKVKKILAGEAALNNGISSAVFEFTKIARLEIMKSLLNNEANNLFYSYIRCDSFDNLIFEYNNGNNEEVSLSREYDGKYFDLVNQFDKISDYENSINLSDENKDYISVEKYSISSNIEDNLDFSSKSQMIFTALENGHKWIPFSIHPKLKIDSILSGGNVKLKYYKEEDIGQVWVENQQSLETGKNYSIIFYFHGNIIVKDDDDWVYIRGSSSWYPRYNGKKKTKFDLEFKVGKLFTDFISVGKLLSNEKTDKYNVSKWETEQLRNASFNLGFFDKQRIDDERIPPLNIYMNKVGHAGESKMINEVAGDIMNSVLLFDKTFGKHNFNELHATEIPYSHGEAFPGLLHLSWRTFSRDNSSTGFQEFFRAHEVAHQWWGIGVDYKTYHDQWLSEGLAEYSGLIYMQTILNQNDKYFRMLELMKKQLLEKRNSFFDRRMESGPIYLGYRTSSSEKAGDYDLIIYEKGAWVLHMLRNMLIDFKTFNEDRFNSILKDYYSTYNGKSASTDDFKKIVEKHLGQDMTWFFDQWIYGTDIPSYAFSYKEIEKTPEGKFKYSCKVTQENTSPDFQMIVPIKIQFKGDRFVRLRYLIKGPITEFNLPALPEEPEEIIFNDLNSVLCEVKYE